MDRISAAFKEEDRKWVIGGGGCAAAGLVVSVLAKNWSWFAVGAVTGAAVVGGRLYSKTLVAAPVTPEAKQVARAVKATRSDYLGRTAYPNDLVGGPTIDPEDVAPANGPRLLSRAEADGYPMRNRIPECDARSLPMDPRGYSGLIDEPRGVW